MNDAVALDEIKRLVAKGDVRFTHHATKRMYARGAIVADVTSAVLSATCAERQESDNHKVTGGTDRDGDELSVVVSLEADVVVITIF